MQPSVGARKEGCGGRHSVFSVAPRASSSHLRPGLSVEVTTASAGSYFDYSPGRYGTSHLVLLYTKPHV